MDETEREMVVDALRNIVRNDATYYEHHQARRWDGREPSGGTIWLTPREIATKMLRMLG